jgi:hypothetical protein
VKFSRSRGSGRHAKDGDVRRPGRQREAVHDDDAVEDDRFDDEPEDKRVSDAAERDFGPYDVTEAPDGIAQLDLGALQIPAVDGVEVRVQADNEGRVQQVVLVAGESALQLGVFAAPRTEGIWAEVRAEIRKQLFNDGVAAEEVEGVYGPELRARVRAAEGLTDIRFVGIDGPRWLVRAVFQGPAAIEPEAAPQLVECLHSLVVDRGQEAMPVREPLPLRLPKEIADQQAEAAAVSEQADTGVNGGTTGGANGSAPRRKPSPRPRRR